jgi:hypothetical protein
MRTLDCRLRAIRYRERLVSSYMGDRGETESMRKLTHVRALCR